MTDTVVVTTGGGGGGNGAQKPSNGGSGMLNRLGKHNDILVIGGVLVASIAGGYMLSKVLSKRYGKQLGLDIEQPMSDTSLGQPDMPLDSGQFPTEVPNYLTDREKTYQLQSGQRIDLTDIDYNDLLRAKISQGPRPFGYGDRVVDNSPFYSPYAGGSPYFVPGGYFNPYAFNARIVDEENNEEETDEYEDDETASMIASDRSLEDVYGIVNRKNADEAEADEMMTGEQDAMFMTPDEIDMYEDGRIETAHPIMPIRYSSVHKGGGWNDMVDDRFNSMVMRDQNGVLIGLRGFGQGRKKNKRRKIQMNY